MKRLSEIVRELADNAAPVEKPPAHPSSSLADPPVTPQEAEAAETAICPRHRSEYRHLNVDGRVYFCPIGRQYYRHQQKSGGMYKPLKYH